MNLFDIIIVLVRPDEPGNVGAVCRAMKNCGLSRLRLVRPGKMHEGTLRARAVHAEDVWDNTRTFDSLEEAVADCSLTIGTTRRRGHKRKAVTMPPCELAALLAARQGNAAILFGNERTGLEDDELKTCNIASHIPASDDFPSFNLSHAVQIYAYELFCTLTIPAPVAGKWVPLDKAGIDGLTASVTGSLASLGFYTKRGRPEQERFFRDIFARAGISEWEASYMADIFAKAARLNNAKQGSNIIFGDNR